MRDRYKTLIISCWVVLFICFVIKLFGGNFFEIACKNDNFIKICNFIDNTILYYFVQYIAYHFGTYYYFKAVFKVKRLTGKLVFIHIIMFAFWLAKLLISILLGNITLLILMIDFVLTIIIPICFDKTLWKRAIIGSILVFMFELVSLVVKDLGIQLITNNTLILLLYSIDHYIMIILYYLYSIKEGGNEHVRWIILFRKRRQRSN